MAIFGKKRLTVEELIEALNGLSDEDKKEVIAKTTSEDVAKAEEDIADKGEDSQSEQDRVDESVGEQEELDDDKDTQTAKDRVDEAEGEDKATEDDADAPVPTDDDDVENKEDADDQSDVHKQLEALGARFDAQDEKIAELADRLSHIVDSLDSQPFGARPQSDDGVAPSLSTDDMVMRSYNRAYRR
nr:MAG TPA: hypothetical protein [Caudoviricetes sp.]